MRYIIKSFLKSYFQNVIEAVGLILFMIVIMTTIFGVLAGVIQYSSIYSSITKASKPWNDSLNLHYVENKDFTTVNNTLFSNDPNNNNLKQDFVYEYYTGVSPNPNNPNLNALGEVKPFGNGWFNTTTFPNYHFIRTNNGSYISSWANLAEENDVNFQNSPDKFSAYMTNNILTKYSTLDKYLKQNFSDVINGGVSSNDITTLYNLLKISNINHDFEKFINFPTLESNNFSAWATSFLTNYSKYRFDFRNELIDKLFTTKNNKNWDYSAFTNYISKYSSLTVQNQQLIHTYYYSSSNPLHYFKSPSYVNKTNGLKIYSGFNPTATPARAPSNTPLNVLVNKKSSVDQKLKQNEIFNLVGTTSSKGSTPPKSEARLKVSGIGITLDTFIIKSLSTIPGFNTSPVPANFANYIALYTPGQNVLSLYGKLSPNSDWTTTDCSEIYFNSLNKNGNLNELNQILNQAFKSNSGYNTFNQSPIHAIISNNNTTLLISTSISAVLLLLGFIFISFTIKKEINKTFKQLGLFKSFGYTTRQLSWIFSTKFFITTIIGIAIGFSISIPIQQFSVNSYNNNLLVPFQNIYIGLPFMFIMFVGLPIMFVIASYIMTLFFLNKPVLQLVKGNQKKSIGILGRIASWMFQKSFFTVKVQASYTFRAFGKFSMVMLVFFTSTVLLIFSFSSIDVIKSLTNNLFITFNKDVDHVSHAALNLTNGSWVQNPNGKSYFIFDNDNGFTDYISTKDGLPQNAPNQTDNNNLDTQYTTKINDLDQRINQNFPSSQQFGAVTFTYNGQTATIDKFLEPGATPIWLNVKKNILALTAIVGGFPNLSVADTTENKQLKTKAFDDVSAIYGFLNESPTSLDRQKNKLFGSLSLFQNLYLSLEFFNKFNPLNPLSSISPSSPAYGDFQSWIPKIPASEANADTQFFKIENNSSANFVPQSLLAALPIIGDKANTYVAFNGLYYNPNTDYPIFRTPLYPQLDTTNVPKISYIGLSEQNLSKFITLSGVDDVNQIFSNDPKYNGNQSSTFDPLNIIISKRLQEIKKWNIGSIVNLKLEKSNNQSFVKCKIVGVAQKDTLSNNIYGSASFMKEWFKQPQEQAGQTTQVGLNPDFYNDIATTSKLIRDKINIKDFISGKIPNLKFYIQNIGISFLQAYNNGLSNAPNSGAKGDPLKLWQVLNFSNNNDNISFGQYNSISNQSLLVNPTFTLPISLIRQIINIVIKQVSKLLTNIQILIACLIFLILVITISAILDEATKIVLTMKSLGYFNREINFIVIGNYVIGIILTSILAYLANIGLWTVISNVLLKSSGILLPVPFGITIPLICFGIIAVILIFAWSISIRITKSKPMSIITQDA